MRYETVIGLEVHLQLKTKTKAFCGCRVEFGQEPNSTVCAVCLGFPGTLPVFNQEVLRSAVKVALALNCQVQEYTKFDRKNYFYPDLPKAYQISQYDLPISKNGFLDVQSEGQTKRIGITRVHIEEDAGKLIHENEISLVDYNRAGIPLLEIVSEPEMNSPQEAFEYLTLLKRVIEYLDVSDCDMEKGSLRCDANISLRLAQAKTLGVKTELKNMNSFKGVKDALTYEIERQEQILESGKNMAQETRLWDAAKNQTVAMRSKEVAKDYRYFPEPDLTEFLIDDKIVREIKENLPALPQAKNERFIKEYGLTDYEAAILVSSTSSAAFAEKCLLSYPGKEKKAVANWLIGPLLAEANLRKLGLSDLGLKPEDLTELIGFTDRQEISGSTAKAVLTQMLTTKKSAKDIITRQNLIQISDSASLEAIVRQVLDENPKSVADFSSGKANALMFLVGQAMKRSQGKANPKAVQDIIKRRLTNA